MNTTFTSIGSLVEAHQAHLGFSDEYLAMALDYQQSNVVTLIKNGTMRLPLIKVPALAKVLCVDAQVVLQLAMAETTPGLYEMIEQIVNPLALREHEVGLIKHCRKLAGNKLTTFIVVDAN
ncbi:hypothetical protein QN397_24950 [Variovorax sp. RTB1]|uniref:hypothetical protein n=1 Tax=Variovorax sp. RTB1 TaxID=3048631 RepID=UPI002B2353EA|nr:hypothetical protein [Variovorax sp. RTB1]MEB0114533.1 hypothetical protein [Variovorax sp. RTB1]